MTAAKPLKAAEYFGLLFNEVPTYAELVSGTPKLAPYLGIKQGLSRCLVPECDPSGSRTHDFRDENPTS